MSCSAKHRAAASPRLHSSLQWPDLHCKVPCCASSPPRTACQAAACSTAPICTMPFRSAAALCGNTAPAQAAQKRAFPTNLDLHMGTWPRKTPLGVLSLLQICCGDSSTAIQANFPSHDAHLPAWHLSAPLCPRQLHTPVLHRAQWQSHSSTWQCMAPSSTPGPRCSLPLLHHRLSHRTSHAAACHTA